MTKIADSIQKYIELDNIDKIKTVPNIENWSFLPISCSIKVFGQNLDYPNIVQYAAYKGAAKCLTFILQHVPEHLDSSPNSIGFHTQNPYPLLHLGVLGGNYECVQVIVLLSSVNPNFDINQVDAFNFSALHFAAYDNSLFENDSLTLSLKTAHKTLLLHEITNDNVSLESKIQIVNYLYSKGGDLFKENGLSDSPLVFSLMNNIPLFNHFIFLLMRDNPISLNKLYEEKVRNYGIPGV
ncbi:hypothetical protein TRFO_11241 [Tritrichomonas foetus]|uniref:Ankyrin repeat protein n=1 Tax=Tritrichomonas foetus TaxID=1144522 RepID=A0A1J4J4X1_9EUKA|nr:hypothetical protein TRFO_11241 [Tritrichomonas foetus]|eukprot:OHS94368.1 hypothetical protein TRFO_11241 [Tritrichomonas foetus]